MSRNIVCLSGGLASAWCAKWSKENLDKPIYYFNDTKWEHADLYRFLDDLERVLGIEITRDTDGRTPEDVFFDQGMLGNNRVPLCSKILKAERLQAFIHEGDVVVFGIDETEKHRATSISAIYQELGALPIFPLISNQVTKEQVKFTIKELGIEEPGMYKLGFKHNNCSGGCVRAGEKTWALLLDKMPEVYKERERVEKDFSLFTGKTASFMKGETLEHFRKRIESQGKLDFSDDSKEASECIGICNLEN